MQPGRTPRHAYWTALLAQLICVASWCMFASHGSAQTDATSVKATFLYRFSSLVDWPGKGAETATMLCVAGPELYERALQRVLSAAGTQRQFHVRHIQHASEVEGCSVLYLTEDAESTREKLRSATGRAVLTVTDASVTPDVRGIIQFTVVDGRVRFHIDDYLAAQGGLSLDSRLLALALSVRRRDGR